MVYKIDYMSSNDLKVKRIFAQGKKFNCKHLDYLKHFKLSDKNLITETYVNYL